VGKKIIADKIAIDRRRQTAIRTKQRKRVMVIAVNSLLLLYTKAILPIVTTTTLSISLSFSFHSQSCGHSIW